MKRNFPIFPAQTCVYGEVRRSSMRMVAARAELGATACDQTTGAGESAVNSVTGSASITDLGLGGASQAAEGAAADGLGSVVDAPSNGPTLTSCIFNGKIGLKAAQRSVAA